MNLIPLTLWDATNGRQGGPVYVNPLTVAHVSAESDHVMIHFAGCPEGVRVHGGLADVVRTLKGDAD